MPALNRKELLSGHYQAEFSKESTLPPVGILQIGDGNFLRAFADWMVDAANGQGLFNGRITIATPLPQGINGTLNAQDGLYTVLLRGVQNGKQVEAIRIISCVDQSLNPYSEWEKMITCVQDPSLRFVISNTTEAGIAYSQETFSVGVTPKSFPAKVTALLYARFKELKGARGTGLIFLPCELISANGTTLHKYVLQYANDWEFEKAFINWIEEDNIFLNTLVDRIVPGFPADEATALYEKLGYADPLLVAAEPFHLWVIEAPEALQKKLSDELPLHKAGIDVVWAEDLAPYRTRKVRILNGAHTASALAAYCAGIDTVKGMIDDPIVSGFLSKVMFDEIVPFVPLPEEERQSYARTIMERFANPFIRHELISISLNSVSKWQVRVLPTVKDFVTDRKTVPAGLSFSLAALLFFYKGMPDENGGLLGNRDTGQAYQIKDAADVLDIFARVWKEWETHKDISRLAHQLLGNTALWGEDLNAIEGLSQTVSDNLSNIVSKGMKRSIQEL